MFEKVLWHFAPMAEADFLQFSCVGLLPREVAHSKGIGSLQAWESKLCDPPKLPTNKSSFKYEQATGDNHQ